MQSLQDARSVLSKQTEIDFGTALGAVNTRKVGSPAATPASFAGIVTTDDEVEMLPSVAGQTKPVTLRGVAEGLAINFAGAALVAGQIHHYTAVWTEE